MFEFLRTGDTTPLLPRNVPPAEFFENAELSDPSATHTNLATQEKPVPLLEVLTAAAPEEEQLPELSWRIVSMIYAAGTALCAIFGVLHKMEVKSVQGFWLIFVVFPPSLCYSLVKWKAQRERHALEAKQAKKD